ncbi:hypothetical protein A9179_18925 [Pseudomonas alcaligenes]|uniref:Lipoprotein n=1 Tax=Aquipseudomonas alcaligenes TaxID=43263 RepID=A0ABR7S453_AQUAC|nr:YbaY family lipoprotein [Pseudomonas alcaligenes]MBC9252350.1 hypothetical protein [Pseudomonas alcaligenes]
MSPRYLPICLLSLLSACTSAPPQPPAPAPQAAAPSQPVITKAETALPAHLRELRGQLRTPPAGSEVELALLVIDERDRPQQLLGNLTLAGNGQSLPFRLPFDPTHFPPGARVELRARVSQSGRLILRLPPQLVHQAQSRDLGALSLVSAP